MPYPPPSAVTRFRPPVPTRNAIVRRRILEALETNDPSFVLIHSPAGYGKSTVAAQWLELLKRKGVKTTWLGLDADANTTTWFLVHLFDAMSQVIPDLDTDLRIMIEENPDDAERYALPYLINTVEAGSAEIAVVFDDWHLVDNPRSRNALAWLLENSGERLRIIVTSRTRTGMPMGRSHILHRVSEVTVEDLKFDLAETLSFLDGTRAEQLDEAEFGLLLQAIDGWAAGLQLFTLGSSSPSSASELVHSLTNRQRTIAAYLTDAVLDSQPPELLDALVRTSITERLSPGLVTALTGHDNGRRLLEDIAERNLFLQALDDESEWFRYHHLFADFLRSRLERDQPELLTDLHRTASRWFAAHSRPAEAVDHALHAADETLALTIVRDHAMNLVEHSRMSTLLALCAKLPSSLVESDGYLQIALAWANCLLHRASDAQVCLDRVSSGVVGADFDAEAIEIEILTIQGCVDMYADRIDRVPQLEEACFPRSDSLRPWVVSVAVNIATFARIHTGRLDEALTMQQWGRRFHDATTGPFSVVYGYLYEGLTHFHAARFNEAQAAIERALDVARKRAGRGSHAARLAGSMLAMLRSRDCCDAEAAALCEEARELNYEGGVVDFLISTYSTLARLRLQEGDTAAATEVLDEAADISDRLQVERLSARVEMERALGRLPGRQEWATPAEDPYGHGTLTGLNRSTTLYRFVADFIRYFAADDGRRHGAADDCTVMSLGTRARELAEASEQGGYVLHALVARHALAQLGEEHSADCSADTARILSVELGLLSAHPRTWQPANVTAHSLPSSHEERCLSDREIEIVSCVSRGMSNPQIAASLQLGVNTVKWHLKNVFQKLGVSSRSECVQACRARGISI